MDNHVKEILNEVWARLPEAYFNRHPKEAISDFLKIHEEIKKEREEKNNG